MLRIGTVVLNVKDAVLTDPEGSASFYVWTRMSPGQSSPLATISL